MTKAELIEKLKPYDENTFVTIMTEAGEVDIKSVRTVKGLVLRNGEAVEEDCVVLDQFTY